jgi:ribose transport system substrate-binding protein
MGGKAIEAAIALLKGETITRRIEVPTPVILTRGDETSSVKADKWAADHVDWDLPDEALLS